MNKLRSILILSLLLSTSAFAQHELEQARFLAQIRILDVDKFVKDSVRNHISIEVYTEWMKIKAFINGPVAYIADGKPVPEWSELLKVLAQMAKDANNKMTSGESGYVGSVSDSVLDVLNGNIGAQFTSQLIVAMSDLIVDRAKAELALQYFERLEKSFVQEISIAIPTGDNTAKTIVFKLKDLFPNSHQALAALVQNNNASVNSIGRSFKEAFELDMKQFYPTASRIFIKGAFGEKAYYPYLESSLFVVEQLLNGQHPSLILQDLSLRHPYSTNNFGKAVHLLYIVSESFKNTTEPSVWVSQDAIDNLTPRELAIYAALLYYNHQAFFTALGFKLETTTNLREKFYPMMRNIAAYVNAAEGMLKELRSGTNTPFAAETKSLSTEEKMKRFFDYAHTSIDLLFLSRTAFCAFAAPGSELCENNGSTYQRSAHRIVEVLQAVEERSYGVAFAKSFQVAEDLSGKTIEIPASVSKIAFLASDIAQADSVSEIKRVLEGAVLPVGSFRIKRQSNFSVHVNAYPGLATGAEYVDEGNLKHSWATHISPFVPVGFDVSWGREKCNKRGRQSNGFFISIIDLGAVASYRIQSDGEGETVDQLPDLQWKQLISPGIFYVRGIKNSPLSWGFGGQMNPDLREIKDASDVRVDTANAFRLSVFVSVDIPFFNLSSR